MRRRCQLTASSCCDILRACAPLSRPRSWNSLPAAATSWSDGSWSSSRAGRGSAEALDRPLCRLRPRRHALRDQSARCMTDITERPKINPRRIAYFGDNLPVSTLVEVKGLVDPRMKVEIECQAYVGEGTERYGGWGP